MAKGEKAKSDEENLKQALLKRAIGFSQDEIVEEYIVDEEGKNKLSKKKVTKKYVAPDINSAKLLLTFYFNGSSGFENMSEEELESEKKKLLELLREEDE